MKHQSETTGWKPAGQDGKRRGETLEKGNFWCRMRTIYLQYSFRNYEKNRFNFRFMATHSQNCIITFTEAAAKTLKLALLSEHVSPQIEICKWPDLQWEFFVLCSKLWSHHITAFCKIYFEVKIPQRVCDIWVFSVVYLIKMVYTLWLPQHFWGLWSNQSLLKGVLADCLLFLVEVI